MTGRAIDIVFWAALSEVIDVLRREDSLFLGEIIKPSGRSSDLNGARYLQQWCDIRIRQKFRDEAYNIPEPAERPDGHLSEDHVGAALGASGHLNAPTIRNRKYRQHFSQRQH